MLPPADPSGPRVSRTGERWLLTLFPLLALLLLWPVLAGHRVLLPAEYLLAFRPWGSPAAAEHLPQWNVLQWDGLAEFYPWRLHAARSMAAGRIPLWNPYVMCGTPFLANSQSAPLYPLHLLYYLPLGLPTAVRMGWVAWLHLSLAGGFGFLLARELEARPSAAVLAGAAYELSGFAAAWLELPSFLSVACWIPLLLLLIGRAVRSGSFRTAAAAGGVTGLMLLAGHLQIAFYGLLAAAAWWLWETIALQRAGGRQALVRSVGIGCVLLGVGMALAAPQMLPSVELSRVSHRVGKPSFAGYTGYLGLALPWQNWVTLLVPDYYGLPGRSDFWGFWKYGPPNTMEYAGSVGAAGFALALIGLARGRRVDRRAGLLGAIGLLALLLAAGSPLCALPYFLVPGFAQTGSPARSLVLFCLAQALLAGLGLERVLRRSEERWGRAAGALAIGAGTTVLLFLGLHLATPALLPPIGTDVEPLLRSVTQPALIRAAGAAALVAVVPGLLLWLFREEPRRRTAAAGWAAAAVVAGGLLLLDGAYNPDAPRKSVYPETPVTSALQRSAARAATLNTAWDVVRFPPALLPPNCSLAYGWRDGQGYDSLELGRYRALANAIAGGDAAPAANGNIVYLKNGPSQLLPLLAARLIVSAEPVRAPGFAPAHGFPPGPPYVYENSLALPEAYVAGTWRAAEDPAAIDYLRARGPGDLLDTAVVAPGAGVLPPPDRAAPAPPEPDPATAVVLERLSPQRIIARAHPDRTTLLVLAEALAPGWKARRLQPDGTRQPLTIHRANLAFQGVFLPAGPAAVEWRYEPASFRLGLFLGLTALAVLAGVTVSRRRPVRL